ncbi:MAG: NUDIX hydrolase [Planctomycetota bacterium]
MGRHNSAFAIIRHRDRILLVRTRCGWQLPGGGLKRDESPRAAARREVHEETGFKARILGLTGVYERNDGTRAFVFAARVETGRDLPGARHEVWEQRWVRFDRALALLRKAARRRLIDALRVAPRRAAG